MARVSPGYPVYRVYPVAGLWQRQHGDGRAVGYCRGLALGCSILEGKGDDRTNAGSITDCVSNAFGDLRLKVIANCRLVHKSFAANGHHRVRIHQFHSGIQLVRIDRRKELFHNRFRIGCRHGCFFRRRRLVNG